MDKEAFIAKFQDELIGLLLEAFADERTQDMATQGRRMVHRMRKSRELLGRMHAAIVPVPPLPVKTQEAKKQ